MTDPSSSTSSPTARATAVATIGKELLELQRVCAEAHSEGGASALALEALRAAVLAVNTLTAEVARIQKEAQDVEFDDTVPKTVRALLDGRLLQRTAYVLQRATTAAQELRMLSQGVRDLDDDCRALHAEVLRLAQPSPAT